MLHKRLTTPESEIPWGPFRLRRAGVPLTVFSILFTLLGFFWSFWPISKSVTPATMNYNAAIYGAAFLFTLIYWFAYARNNFVGPVWTFAQGEARRVR